MKREFRWLVCALVALGSPGCWELSDSDQEAPVQAKFGVFFGGQVQERREVPFVLDSTRQTQGFRIELSEAAPADLEVRWELEMPAPRTAGRGKTMTKLGKSLIRRGESRLDQRLGFEPGDPLGLYNVRVFLGDELLVDRAFVVYDEAARRRASQPDDE